MNYGVSLKTNLFRSIAAGIPIIRKCFWNPQQRVFTRFLPQWQIMGFLSLSLCVDDTSFNSFQLNIFPKWYHMDPYGTPKSNFHGCATSHRERRRVSRMLRRRRARDLGQVPASSKSLIWCTHSSSQNLAKIYKLTWLTNRLYHYNHYHDY